MKEAAQEIMDLYRAGGAEAYFGERVTQLDHALQSAYCARKAHADSELVAASLLHDIGHLLGGNFQAELGVIDHNVTAIPWLRDRGFSERLIALVAGHVDAKRYLITMQEGYYERLSPTSQATLALQGGRMSSEEAEAFEQSLYFADLLRLRSWDEMAKDPDMIVPGLEDYRDLLEQLAGPATRHA